MVCLGEASLQKGDLDLALKYLEQAQTLSVSEQNNQSFTVSSFYQGGNLQSIDTFEQSWPRMAARADLNETLGETLFAQQQYRQAALTVKNALYEFPISTRASLGLAKSLIAQNKYGGAIAVLHRYLKFNPENAEAQDLLNEALSAY